MANQKQLEILKRGVDFWNQWRQDNPEVKPDLSGVNLRGLDLNWANLHRADLSKANLSQANLSYADLSFANLREANLNQAYLQEAFLREADLREADLREANLIGANLYITDLREADLSEANLGWTTLTDADLRKTNLTGCFIYGVSAWDLKLEGAKQSGLIIAKEPTVTVDNIEVAQFIHLLLNHKGLRNVLNAVTEKGVLILGRFVDGGLELLQAIAAKLRDSGYLPIIFDFEKPEARNYTETIKTLAGLSRFVIADLSGPSVPQELYATVPHFKIPFVPIIEKGRREYAMFVDLLEYPWVLPPVEFEDKAQLLELLPVRVIEPAEDKFKERQKKLDELFK